MNKTYLFILLTFSAVSNSYSYYKYLYFHGDEQLFSLKNQTIKRNFDIFADLVGCKVKNFDKSIGDKSRTVGALDCPIATLEKFNFPDSIYLEIAPHPIESPSRISYYHQSLRKFAKNPVTPKHYYYRFSFVEEELDLVDGRMIGWVRTSVISFEETQTFIFKNSKILYNSLTDKKKPLFTCEISKIKCKNNRIHRNIFTNSFRSFKAGINSKVKELCGTKEESIRVKSCQVTWAN